MPATTSKTVFRQSLTRSRHSADQNEGIAQLVRYWCAAYCVSPWTVEENDRFLVVTFTSNTDAVLFKLTEECSYFDAAEILFDDQ